MYAHGAVSPLGFTITGADTAAHAFTDGPALEIHLQTPSTNTGTVTITDLSGAAGGLVIPKGQGTNGTSNPIRLGPIVDMKNLTYQFSNASDVLMGIILR